MSCVLAPLIATPIGTPRASVSTERLVPSLPRSVGFLPVFSPTQRRLTHRSVNALPIPLNGFELVIFKQACLPQLAKNTSFGPLLKVAMERATGTKFTRDSFPLATRSQNIKNTAGNSTEVHTRTTTFGIHLVFRKKFLHLTPESVW